MICKHLIQLKGVVDVKFFHKIQRNHNYPFICESVCEIFYETNPIARIIEIPEDNTKENWKEYAITY